MRFGLVLSATRLLFGIDYADCLLAFYFGPVALCFAWGAVENNPFTTDAEMQEIIKKERKRAEDENL